MEYQLWDSIATCTVCIDGIHVQNCQTCYKSKGQGSLTPLLQALSVKFRNKKHSKQGVKQQRRNIVNENWLDVKRCKHYTLENVLLCLKACRHSIGSTERRNNRDNLLFTVYLGSLRALWQTQDANLHSFPSGVYTAQSASLFKAALASTAILG